eukprot:COSAG03_NODE_232_length_10264_cov_2.708706_6_plen_72_part_00
MIYTESTQQLCQNHFDPLGRFCMGVVQVEEKLPRMMSFCRRLHAGHKIRHDANTNKNHWCPRQKHHSHAAM